MDNTQKLIAAAGKGNADQVRHLLSTPPPKSNNNAALEAAAEHGHAECVQLLLAVSDVTTTNFVPLILAAQNGHVECVDLLQDAYPHHANTALKKAVGNGHLACAQKLLHLCDATTLKEALAAAAGRGQLKCLQWLCGHSDPNAWEGYALIEAAECGQLACLNFLLPLSDTSPTKIAMCRAAMNGHVECLRALVDFSCHTSEQFEQALYLAIKNNLPNRDGCVDLLFPLCNVRSVLLELQDDFPDQPQMWGDFEMMVEAQEQRERLQHSLELPLPTGRSSRKI